MGFFKKVFSAVAAPVVKIATAPIALSIDASKALAKEAAPVVGGLLGEAKSIAQIEGVSEIAGAGLAFNSGGLLGASSFLSRNDDINPSTARVPIPTSVSNTSFQQPQENKFLIPLLVAGGGLLIFLLTKKRK